MADVRPTSGTSTFPRVNTFPAFGYPYTSHLSHLHRTSAVRYLAVDWDLYAMTPILLLAYRYRT